MLKFYEAKNVGIALAITRLFRQNRMENIEAKKENLFFYHYLVAKGSSFIATERPAIRSYCCCLPTTHANTQHSNTTTIGASWKGLPP